MKNIIIALIFCFLIFIYYSKKWYNKILIQKIFKYIKNGKFKKALNLIKYIFGKSLKDYLTIELVRSLLKKNKIGKVYFLYEKNSNPIVKFRILGLMIIYCIDNNDIEKVEQLSLLLESYSDNKTLEIYKKIIVFYESNLQLEKISKFEKLDVENLDIYVALSYIKLESLGNLKRNLKNIQNNQKIALLIHESFVYYKEKNKLSDLNKFYLKLALDEPIKKNIDELIVKIYIEEKNYEKAKEKILFLSFKKQFEYYLLIAKNLKKNGNNDEYVEKSYNLIEYFVFPTEKVLALIKLSYLTINEEKYKNENKFLEEAYKIYSDINDMGLDLSKEFILLFREQKNYERFIKLLEKKSKIYKDVISLESLESIRYEFVRSINSFLWGNQLNLFEDFMKSYNTIQLKEGNLEYDEFCDLINQIKRYVNESTYKEIQNIVVNLFQKPNILFFINQYLKMLKEKEVMLHISK